MKANLRHKEHLICEIEMTRKEIEHANIVEHRIPERDDQLY